MYYSVTQVCRCNEETRTNSSETSLTGQPLYDTSTNELYIGDGETTIQNLSPIQNLKAGSGMTYTNGSVSLNQGTQTNAGGIKVWAENNDVYYSTNGGGAQLFPIIRKYHPGYTQTHPNFHTLSGTASTPYDTGDRQPHHHNIDIALERAQYDTGDRQPHHHNIDIALERAQYNTGDRTPHNDDINITLNYKGTTEGFESATGRATGTIYCNEPGYDNAFGSRGENITYSLSPGKSFIAHPNVVLNVANSNDWEYVNSSVYAITSNGSGYLACSALFLAFQANEPNLKAILSINIRNTSSEYTVSLSGYSVSINARRKNGTYSGSDDYDVGDIEVTSIGTPIITQNQVPITPVDKRVVDLTSIGIIRTRVTMNRIPTVQYVTPFEHFQHPFL